MTQFQYVVVSAPVVGKEEEFNTWYDQVHIPDVLRVPCFKAAQRFKLPEVNKLGGQYMAIYEIDTDDIQKVMAELHSRVGTPAMLLSPSMDMSKVSTTLCTAIAQRCTAVSA